MNSQQHFKEYESKLQLEALLKSLLAGAIVGGGVGSLTALITWYFGVIGWLPIAVSLLFIAAFSAIFYIWRFRPTLLDKARRLDGLGLQERLITMVEYQNDDSYMAAVQREDATARLNQIHIQDLQIKISLSLIIPSIVTFVLCVGLTTLSILATFGIIKSGQEFIDEIIPDEPEIQIEVEYEVEEGGSIEGEEFQLVIKGQDATPVLAVAEDGYIFLEWSDGVTDPYRHDTEILEKLEITAIFELDEEGGDGDGEGDDEGEGDGDGDMPADEGDTGDQTGEESEEDGKPSDESQESDKGEYGKNNYIYSDNKHYRDEAPLYKEELIQFLEENQDKLTPEQIAIIKAYIESV